MDQNYIEQEHYNEQLAHHRIDSYEQTVKIAVIIFYQRAHVWPQMA